MLASLLALAASVSWGSSNFIAGLESRRRSVWTVAAVSHVASCLSAGVVLFFAGQSSLAAGQLLWAVCAGVAGAGAVLALYRALAIGSMSVVSPIIAIQVTIPVAAGMLWGERPAHITYVGMVLAVVGVALVSRRDENLGAHVPRAAILLALLTAALYGVMLVGLDKAGSGGSGFWAVVVVRAVSACVVLGYFVASRKHLEMTAKAVLLTAATTLFTAAVTMGLLSVVSVLASLSPVVTTALAQIFLHERLGRRQWMGVAVILAGVVLLTA